MKPITATYRHTEYYFYTNKEGVETKKSVTVDSVIDFRTNTFQICSHAKADFTFKNNIHLDINYYKAILRAILYATEKSIELLKNAAEWE